MRTVLITNGNLLSLLSLADFLRMHSGDLAGVVLTTRLPSQKSNVAGLFDMWRRSGWSYTHFKLLTNVLLPRRLRRRGLATTVVEFLQRLKSPAEIIHAANVNAPETVERVRRLAPELLLSFSATMRFDDPLLETPRRGAINAHYALLPGYAGLSPYFWYLHNGERESGVTLHRIIPKLDAGPIIEQQRFGITDERTVLAVLRRQMDLVSPMLLRYYRGETSDAGATPQDLSRRSYFGHPTRQQIRQFRSRGLAFYDRQDLIAVEARVTEVNRMADSQTGAAAAGAGP